MRAQVYIVGGVLLTILVVVAAVTYHVRSVREEAARNQAAADLYGAGEATYTDMLGNTIDLSEVAEDTVVVVTSWASWCPQCAGELALIDSIVAERDAAEVRALAINRMEPKEQAARFMGTLPEFSRLTFVLDNQDFYFRSVEGYAMPETLVYNRNGEVVLHKRGNLTTDELRAAVDQAISSAN